MPSVLDNAPVTQAEKAAELKKMSERDLLADIAESERKSKGYIQAMAIIMLFNVIATFAVVIAMALQSVK